MIQAILDQAKATSAVEWVAVIFTLLNVILAMRASIWNFPIGIVSAAAYGWVFFQSKYYFSTWLQVLYYVPMMVIGWWVWVKGGPQKIDDLPIRWNSPFENSIWLVVTVIASVICGAIMASTSQGNFPYWDALATGASIVGQVMLTRKRVENWIYWVGVNTIYAFILMPSQKLWMSAALFVLLLGMALRGWIMWSKAAKTGAVHA